MTFRKPGSFEIGFHKLFAWPHWFDFNMCPLHKEMFKKLFENKNINFVKKKIQ
jgi:hypothetical protein